MPKGPVEFEGEFLVHRVVANMKASIDFYVTVLGFFYDHGIRDMAWLRRAGIMLTLSPEGATDDESPAQASKPAGFNPDCGYFGWSVSSMEELEQAYEQLYRKGVRLSSPPSAEEGRSWFFLYDPDGYPVCLSYVRLEYPEGRLPR